MASLFSYETERILLESPWPAIVNRRGEEGPDIKSDAHNSDVYGVLADYGISKLEAEPQEGPIEYKLHLLLRPRRNFSATSTVQRVSGSHLSKSRLLTPKSENGSLSLPSTPPLASSSVSRQNRIQHLTTQLLWRLQQSCPHHESLRSDLVLPALPESDIQKSLRQGPGKLVGGLEESLGALYELGVSDDGSFVGLIQEELDESLAVLRAMSYSLGCDVKVMRTVDVGECQWNEEEITESSEESQTRVERLKVAEVLVSPSAELFSQKTNSPISAQKQDDVTDAQRRLVPRVGDLRMRQLRVSLTGCTTSGKSSLLGTLSTSTLDNGRGKSRLSLLKHRHEIVSGVTSSLAQELIGYHDLSPQAPLPGRTQIVNYATPNVSSWGDIHNLTQPGRLVFVTDSAGHPRYRRTALRGVVSWAPDWTLCCIAADETEDNAGKVGATASASDILGYSASGVDVSKAHLELCLKLGLSIIVVITKMDLASKNGLRETLTKTLSTLKEAGRKPVILPNLPASGQDPLASTLLDGDNEIVDKALQPHGSMDPHMLVPIVLASAVTGAGISKIHSLLRHLPTCPQDSTSAPQEDEGTGALFHIDEVFSVTLKGEKLGAMSINAPSDHIISGYLRHGKLEVGQHVYVGPTDSEAAPINFTASPSERANSYPGHPKEPSQDNGARNGLHRAVSSNLTSTGEMSSSKPPSQAIWPKIVITSIRYLRLPVRSLHNGQVATVGFTFLKRQSPPQFGNDTSFGAPTLRRGMVLLESGNNFDKEVFTPPAYGAFTAVFKDANAYVIPGSTVTVYIASIRTSAKILEVRAPEANDIDDEIFSLERDFDKKADTPFLLSQQVGPESIEITFQFVSSREWVEIGSQVLIIPAGGLSMINPPEQGETGYAGLDGFVGKITNASV